jgi:hypothetical protein
MLIELRLFARAEVSIDFCKVTKLSFKLLILKLLFKIEF